MMVGFECRPKNESLIVVPPAAASPSGTLDFDPPFSDGVGVWWTDLLTAAKTTLANEIPEVEPKNLESEAPWTETMTAAVHRSSML